MFGNVRFYGVWDFSLKVPGHYCLFFGRTMNFPRDRPRPTVLSRISL